MEPAEVKSKLIAVLQQVQALSGEECPSLDGDIKPAETLMQFTSKIFPTATGMLSQAIGKNIPCEVNIFVDDETKRPMAINQIAALVCKIAVDQTDDETEATS